MDLARKYEIDGINFDYLRYPGRDFPDADSYRRYGLGIPRDRWRKSNLDRFVSECYDRLTALRPLLKVGSSPLGIYGVGYRLRLGRGRRVLPGYADVAQDGETGLRRPPDLLGHRRLQGEPDFAALVPDWQQLAGARHVYAGIGAYKSDVAREFPARSIFPEAPGTPDSRISGTRASGCRGSSAAGMPCPRSFRR